MLSINWSDVWKMVESIKVPLIVIGVALALAIIVSLAVMKLSKPARKLARSTAWIAAFVTAVLAVVSMMYGGFKTVLDLASGSGVLTDASKAQVEKLGNDIADEGMVLLKNTNAVLPLAEGSAINVWGWGSTNPIYGGTGSGSLSKDNPTTSLLDGLRGAGFTTNDELTDLYTSYRAERPEVGMFKADWSLPEPTKDKYTQELLDIVQAFGETAVVTIARSGGEGFDLPRDVNKETSENPAFSYTNNSEQYADFEDGQGYLELTRPEKDMIELAKQTSAKTVVVINAANAFQLGDLQDDPENDAIGTMAHDMQVSGWYAPATNTHRYAYAGRNFEYFSEDPVLAGSQVAEEIKGAQAKGVYAFLKHFALNDQETNRTHMLATWTNEQAMREIYLRSFEIGVKDGGAHAIMSAFNYIGTEYAGAKSALLKTVLRDEWGFRGMVLTDYFAGLGYQNADQITRHGGDIMLATIDMPVATLNVQDAAGVTALRGAAHNILYTVANSWMYENGQPEVERNAWEYVTWAVAGGLILALVGLEVVALRRYRARRAGAGEAGAGKG